MVFTREKNTSNQNRERCLFTCEKNDTSNQKPQRCVSFAPKFPPFIAACSAASHTFNEESFTQRVFLAKKVKISSEMEWNSFVCFTVDKENGREPAKQQRKGINAGAPNDNFRKIICSEDDLRSRIFGSFSVKFLACLPLLGFSNIKKVV